MPRGAGAKRTQRPALRNHPSYGAVNLGTHQIAAPGCWGGAVAGKGGGGTHTHLSLLLCNKCEILECGSWNRVVVAVFPGLTTRRRRWVRPGPVGEDDIPERVN